MKKLGYRGKDIKETFKEADKELPNISTSIYTRRTLNPLLLHMSIMKKIATINAVGIAELKLRHYEIWILPFKYLTNHQYKFTDSYAVINSDDKYF
ncbi:hypothetical protein RIR_jg31475.t1 [Rhizophagus irregularis DAOM 181602=DAOM 197198]|uniref:Uncharacterized protein n=1 Tax=Rhizophagus irregularis (strain DAOM 197198w) TaxID=1432141 RepID=A0A015L974_RHIIW|nr:hypothetical protein RirG_262450 [Rhizophagus irregularis DAOM 197198w]PKY21947.1 hypothetical protein RhiirB3_435699 [Rhizophagus irregularis]GBC30978.1 hypothetical protein RIR_jg31475.t1 [Rhizophagus irregularis DAOM 181602=DAOM 197198]